MSISSAGSSRGVPRFSAAAREQSFFARPSTVYFGSPVQLTVAATIAVSYTHLAGTLDAGLLALVDGMEDLEHAVILEDAFVAAVPRSHPLAKKKTVSLADLEDEPVLLLEDGHCLRTQALALCKRAGATETDLRATSLATLVQMVSSGAGVTLLPSIAVDVENRRGQLAIRPLAGRPQGRTICLAWRKAAPLAGALSDLATTMATAAGNAILSPRR